MILKHQKITGYLVSRLAISCLVISLPTIGEEKTKEFIIHDTSSYFLKVFLNEISESSLRGGALPSCAGTPTGIKATTL